MTRIPLKPADAFWNLHRCLDDLLGWARDVDPGSINDSWLSAQQGRLKESVSNAIDAVNQIGENRFADDLSRAQSLGLRFAGNLHRHDSLRTLPAREWALTDDRRQFEELSELSEGFRKLGEGSTSLPVNVETNESFSPTNDDSIDASIGNQTTDKRSKTEKFSWKEIAMAYLFANPEASMTQLAAEIGVSRQYLYKIDGVKEFAASLRAAHRSAKNPPRGTKNDGNLEAYDDE